MNTTAIAPLATTTLTTAQHFDTSILAGVKSPSSIAQYKMHFAAYVAYAANNPSTLAAIAL